MENKDKQELYPMRPKGVVTKRPTPVVANTPTPDSAEPPPKRPKGKITGGEKPLPPNWKCYPELFKGRVDEHGNWLGGRVPKCKVCQGLLQPQENHVCEGYYPKYPGLRSDISPELRERMRHAKWELDDGDWDDDQYDPTTEGEILMDPDEEYSSVLDPNMDDETCIAMKRRRMGLSHGYDPPDFDGETD
jgi:hypothetical protein